MIPYEEVYAYYMQVDTAILPPRLMFESWQDVYNYTFKTYLSLRKQNFLTPNEATSMLRNMMHHVKNNPENYKQRK